MEGDHHRYRAAQERAVDPGGVKHVAEARVLSLNDLALAKAAQRREQAPSVAADAARVLSGPAVERDLHRGIRATLDR